MLIEAEVRDSQILDWLCRQQDTLAVDVEFSHRSAEKEYSALPLHIQAFTKSSRVMKSIAQNQRVREDKVENESIRSDSRDSFTKKRSYYEHSVDSRSVTSSSSRAAEWYPRDMAANGVKNGKTVKLNQPIKLMEDSNDLLLDKDVTGLWQKFQDQGFLYFKDFLNKEVVLGARQYVLDNLRSMGHIDEENKVLAPNGWTIDVMNGAMISGKDKYSDGSRDQQWKKICQSVTMKSVYANDRISGLLQMLQTGMERSLKINCVAQEFRHNFGFLRVKGPKEYTSEHADIFYFRNETEMFNFEDRKCYFNTNQDGKYCEVCRKTTANDSPIFRCEECQSYYHVHCVKSKAAIESMEANEKPKRRGFVWHCADCLPQHNFGTCWIPLGDVEVEEGVLALIPHSFDLPQFYDNIQGTQLPKSYFTYAKGRTWCTGPYSAGDVVFFDSRLIHCTSSNKRNSYRLSLDVRWDLVPMRENVWSTDVGKFVKKYTTRAPTVFYSNSYNNSSSSSGSGVKGGGASSSSVSGAVKPSTTAAAARPKSLGIAFKDSISNSDSDDTQPNDESEESNSDFDEEYDEEDEDDVTLSVKQKRQRREENKKLKKQQQRKKAERKEKRREERKKLLKASDSGKHVPSSSSNSTSSGGVGKGSTAQLMLPPSSKKKRKPETPKQVVKHGF